MTDTDAWIPGPEKTGVVLDLLDRIIAVIVAIGLFAMSMILVIQVAARYVLNSPTVWSEELAISLFVWTAMLAIPLGLRRGEHLTLDLVSKRLPKAGLKALSVAIALITIVTFALIGYFAASLMAAADRQLLAGIAGGLGVQAKVSWVYLAVPVGSALSIIFTIERLVLLLRNKVSVLNADADMAVIEQLDEEMRLHPLDAPYDPAAHIRQAADAAARHTAISDDKTSEGK